MSDNAMSKALRDMGYKEKLLHMVLERLLPLWLMRNQVFPVKLLKRH